jgi:hypothetical protein
MVNSDDEQGRMEKVIVALNMQFGLISRAAAFDGWKKSLATEIDRLIGTDFPKLINVLYRLDISEQKLKQLLKENPSAGAGIIITDLIIERQVEKMLSREKFRGDDNDISEEERW